MAKKKKAKKKDPELDQDELHELDEPELDYDHIDGTGQRRKLASSFRPAYSGKAGPSLVRPAYLTKPKK